ncbi:hypothetical protein [Aeromonas media]|uniref:hypothetical protein n=1 Tax=Aeromonas media TaxID=651 RepID=UPI001C0EDFA1|nr:hypothetical protein [Aeromonas media]
MAENPHGIYADYPFGKAALARLAPLPENFVLYEAELLGEGNGMKVTGAVFRAAKRGPKKGKLTIMVPGTKEVVYLSVEEINKYDPMTGAGRIGAERLRQMSEEGWSIQHDDQHGPVVLESAALSYRDAQDASSPQPAFWPWSAEWWKPKGRQRNLERAGALYQAAADAAERAGDYERRNNLLGHVESCSILLDSIISADTVK